MIQAAFEHVAINVPDRDAVITWYVDNLGLQVVRDVPGDMAFLADSHGIVILEIYSNQSAGRFDLPNTDPLAIHIGFEVDDPGAAAQQLVKAGATVHDDLKTVRDDSMIMLRDPFGLGLQLLRRGAKMRRD